MTNENLAVVAPEAEAANEATETVEASTVEGIDLNDIESLDEPEPTETEETEEGEPETDEAEEAEAEPEQPEEIELDFGGNKVKFLKDAPVEQAAEALQSYAKEIEAGATKKFQEAAEQRKQVEADRAVVDKLSALNGQVLEKYSSGLNIRQELQRLQQIDVSALWQSNPDQARQVSDTINAKTAQLAQIVNEVNQAEAEMEDAKAQEMARVAEAGKVEIEKRIPDFQAKLPEIIDYAVSRGISQEEAEAAWSLNPYATEMTYKAMMYDRMQAAQSAKPTPPKQAKPLKPVAGAGAKAGKTPGEMTPGEMAKYLGVG